MNIVLIGGQNVPGIGGAEAYMFNLAKVLLEKGHGVTIICSNRSAMDTYVDGIKIIHKKCPESNVIALPMLFFVALGYIFKHRKNIDVVNYHAIYLAFIPGWFVRMMGCKVFYTIHSFAEDNPKHSELLKMAMKTLSWISIWGCGRNLQTISHSKVDVIKERYGKTAAVIPCGVNLQETQKETDILKRFGIKEGKYYLTIGRIDPIKNLDVLVKAFCKRNNKEYQLIIAGDNHNTFGDYLKVLAKDHPNVMFIGRVMGDDKEWLLKNCFVNCLVSSSEGMPISLLEAMVYGKTCIVSDIPAIREIMRDEWGQWCQVGDVDSLAAQMQFVEDYYDQTLQRGEEMSSYVREHHVWDKIADKYVDYVTNL